MSFFDNYVSFVASYTAWILNSRNPVRNLIISLIVLIASSGALVTGIYFADNANREKQERNRLKILDYQTQIQQLNDTENNIRHLLDFIETQKNTLRETEDTISLLKKEQEKLKPIVESDKAIVEAIFRAQEERTNSSIWRERWIGFGVGVFASLIASLLWFIISILFKNSGQLLRNKQ